MTRQPGQPAGARGPGALILGEDDRRELAPGAADCAARTLPLFEAQAPGDTRPRDAIEGLPDVLRRLPPPIPAGSMLGALIRDLHAKVTGNT